MISIVRRMVFVLALMVISHAISPAALAQDIVLSVVVTTQGEEPKSSEYNLSVGKEISLYSGPTYRLTAIPTEIEKAAAVFDFKIIPVGSTSEQSVPPGTMKMALRVGEENGTVLGLESPSQVHPKVKVSLKRK